MRNAELCVADMLDALVEPDGLLREPLDPDLDAVDLVGTDVIGVQQIGHAPEERMQDATVRIRLVRLLRGKAPHFAEVGGDDSGFPAGGADESREPELAVVEHLQVAAM